MAVLRKRGNRLRQVPRRIAQRTKGVQRKNKRQLARRNLGTLLLALSRYGHKELKPDAYGRRISSEVGKNADFCGGWLACLSE